MRKNIRKSRGITLISLVVTIVVLLILAGVSIGLVFNSEGLFEKTNSAASKYNTAKNEEEEFLRGIEEYLDRYNRVQEATKTSTPTPTPEPTQSLPAVGAEVPAAGWTIEEAKGLVERDGLQAHLGEKVAYQPAQDTTGVYRIFYHDNEPNNTDPTKGYFGDPLGTLYLKRDYVSNDTTLSSYTSYVSTDNGAIMKQMNPKWAASTNSNSIDLENEHCVAWLCDASQWTKYKEDGVANYVIGSPSVEMYMKAFGVYKETDGNPDRNSTALVCRIGNANGYNVGAKNDYRWNGSNEHWTGDNSIEAGPNNIFMTAGDHDWWLASPSSSANNIILYVAGGIATVSHHYPVIVRGTCPVVSIS